MIFVSCNPVIKAALVPAMPVLCTGWFNMMKFIISVNLCLIIHSFPTLGIHYASGTGLSAWDTLQQCLHENVTEPESSHSTISKFSSVAQLCPILCNPMNCSTPGLSIHHQLPEFIQTCVHRVGDAIQPSHPLSSPSPPTFNHSQHQGLFQWVSSSHQVAKVLEFQLQHQSFQWTLRTYL